MKRKDILEKLIQNRDLFERFLVKNLYLFGSVVRDESRKDSDVDILVEYKPEAIVGLFQFARLRRELSNLLECRVDLATPDSLHKEPRESILEEAVHAE
jgi:predicted nucleotidyltransferase